MDMLHAETNLRKPIEDLVLAKGSSALVFDSFLQVTTVTEVHDDAQLASFRLEHLNKSHDVRMVECLE